LAELVHQSPGNLWRVIVEPELRGYERQRDDVGVAVAGHPVGRICSQHRDGLFARQAGNVHHRSGLPQQPARTGVFENALVEEPQELAQA
jgi:hypothetical protein